MSPLFAHLLCIELYTFLDFNDINSSTDKSELTIRYVPKYPENVKPQVSEQYKNIEPAFQPYKDVCSSIH